jgi:hypothetical protein
VDTADIQWKPIPGFDKYYINTNGDVCRIWKYTKPSAISRYKRGNHPYVAMFNNSGKRQEMSVRCLMELVYFKKPTVKARFVHLNGNTEDCSMQNLGYIIIKNPKQRGKEVARLDKYGNITRVFPSAAKASNATTITRYAICNHCNGVVKGMLAADGFQYKWNDNLDF